MAGSPIAGDGGDTARREVFRFSPRPNRASEINWLEWGARPFELAEEQGKLVLLSISAVWCHWCHVMDETTYSDPGIIDKINSDFVPVRVDSDRRPDINRRYNQGGWPSTVFLVPSGAAVTGLTFAPPPQMLTILERLGEGYVREKEAVDLEAAERAEMERELYLNSEPAGEIDRRAAAEVEGWVLTAWDKGYGGIGSAPKFPPVGAVEFALWRHLETGSHALKSFVVSTLDGMRNGELFDRVEGGFFRYATGRDWSAPHYEKMLADNAELAWLYLCASVALGRDDYAGTARLTIDYVLSNLLDDERRGFYGSQDADEEYYHRDAEGRAQIRKPPIDETIYTDSTSRMVSTLVLASAVFGDPGLLALAERVADTVWRSGFRHAVGACHFFDAADGRPRLWGQPSDQVYLLKAMLELYQATAGVRFLERSIELASTLIDRHVSGHGWLVEAGTTEGGVAATVPDAPEDIPDIVVNAVGARALAALGELDPEGGFGEAAGRILASYGERYKQYTHFSAGYAMATEIFAEGFIEVRVSQDADEESRRRVTAAAVAAFNPRKIVRPETVEDFLQAEDADGAAPPAAVVCSPGRCVPVGDAGELAGVLGTIARSGRADEGLPDGA